MHYNCKNSVAVILKTHIWNDDILSYSKKIYHDCVKNNIDFYILMHDENQMISAIKEPINNIIITFTELDIKKLYTTGFYSMWLSNHWILMFFFKKYGSHYKYIWSMEYDVRISGDSSILWNYKGTEDFIYAMGNYQNLKNKYINYYVGNKLSNNNKYHGYLQLARYSNRCLKYLDECYTKGENGQDELITFSLINRAKFSSSKTFLQKLIRGTWTWQNIYSESNRKLYDHLENNNTLAIFHPVK
ncbi:hypothetical protein QKC54_gp0294 [Megavirus baoshan]|uniref:Uncharacterized protein n=1 Tax=Megavirus baoshan TaxID=2496520 RepID=A0A3Q8U892_9VIRU|nr:hypothetical protein QKC54_gp0294 [Megavirus baoshan]AZL89523.1 hypothetical protein Mb0778 [Megavirus baoshan]